MDLPLMTILITLWSAFVAMALVATVLFWRGRRTRAQAVTLAWRGRNRRVAPPVRLSPRVERPDSAALENAHRLWLDGLSGQNNWENLTDTGRHHLPPELLRMSTYQLGPDRVARAKVPDQN
ncbi:hypothetical protein [Actinoplanes sp. NPDC051859]|uniref:hypothetical protein n=1 Tax=Actinoplanes sp. NPDC051859 TaxID=3363909 RepID=UPI0037BD8C2F